MDALTPHLESLLKEHGNNLVDLVENFPDAPTEEKRVSSVFPSHSTFKSKMLKALTRVNEAGPTGKLPPHVVYLIELGMDLEQIKVMTRRLPSLAGKIKPVVEFLIDLGISKSDVPSILARRPQLCGISLGENLIPTLTMLENLGVDKGKWAKVLYQSPGILAYSKQKIQMTVDFLCEMCLSAEGIVKILTHYPNMVSYSVEQKLRPTVECFHSLGVDVAVLLHQIPQTFGLSIDANFKSLTEFFLESGYSIEEVGAMVSRFGGLYIYSLAENLILKWEFFLTMDYPKEALIRCPQ